MKKRPISIKPNTLTFVANVAFLDQKVHAISNWEDSFGDMFTEEFSTNYLW